MSGELRALTARAISYLAPGGVRRRLSDKLNDFVSVKDFGAVGDGVTDDTAAVQAAINASNRVYLPPGNYRITSTLLYYTVGYASGLKIIGSGMYSSGFTFAFATGQPCLKLDGASGFLGQFQFGSELKDFYIIPASGYASGTQGAAIEMVGLWNGDMSRVRVDGVKGDALKIPLRVDLSTNPDLYATINLLIKHCRLVNCSGIGVNGEAGLAFSSPTIDQCYIGGNASGGLVLGGHQPKIIGGAVFSNGLGTVSPGIWFKRVQTNLNGISVRNVELDNNKSCHIRLEGVNNGEIIDNRMNSWETVFNDGSLSPPVHIKIANAIAGAQNLRVVFRRNYHRSQWTGTVTPGPASVDHALSLYDIGNNANNTYLEIADAVIPSSDNTPTLTKYANLNGNSRVDIRENFSIVNPVESTTAVYSRIVAAQDLATTSTQLLFESEARDRNNAYDHTTSTFVAPYAGIYQLSAGITVGSLTLGNQVRMYIFVNGSSQREVTQYAGGLTYQTFQFCTSLYLAAGDTVIYKGDQNSGSAKAIRAGTPYNWLWIMGVN